MPKIIAFRGIHPAREYAEQVVLEVENLDLNAAKKIRDQFPNSFVNMLVPKLENRFLMGSKTELAFKKINENFEDFLDKGILKRDDRPSLYVYEVKHLGFTQTGIWTVSAIDDYLNNTIKKHELTRAERERGLIDYMQQTGIDANPVLIAYHSTPEIESIIALAKTRPALLHFSKSEAEHTVWQIDDPKELSAIEKTFAGMENTYIADGHHRAAAASTYGIERRKLNLKHRGSEAYNFFTSVYMATDQLRIFEFHRLVKDLGKLSATDFLKQLSLDFEVKALPSSGIFKPEQQHQFGLYLAGEWYQLSFKGSLPDNPVQQLDVAILQDRVLTNILHITDPRTDKRLSFAGGITPVETLVQQVDEGVFDALFTLFPTSIEELIKVADAGEVMPPKSTWFEPKFPAGLLINQLI